MAPKRRTAALVISTFVEPEGNPPWYARIAFYEDAFAPAVQTPPQTTIDGVTNVVRRWLESVTADDSDSGDTRITAS
jgi:hypothetical protein